MVGGFVSPTSHQPPATSHRFKCLLHHIRHHQASGAARRGGFGGGGGSDGRGASRRASMTGLMVLLAATTMAFAAFTSAFVVRRGMSNDWVRHAYAAALFG